MGWVKLTILNKIKIKTHNPFEVYEFMNETEKEIKKQFYARKGIEASCKVPLENSRVPAIKSLLNKLTAIETKVEDGVTEIVWRLYILDKLICNVAFFEGEVTSDNIVSKLTRKLFNIETMFESSLKTKSSTAKSKWHEILIKSERVKKRDPLSIQYENFQKDFQNMERSFLPEALRATEEISGSKSTNSLENSSETVSNASEHADMLNK